MADKIKLIRGKWQTMVYNTPNGQLCFDKRSEAYAVLTAAKTIGRIAKYHGDTVNNKFYVVLCNNQDKRKFICVEG